MANRYDKNGNKLYPWSNIKYGHNIELAYNHLYLLTHEDEDTMREEGLLRIPDETYDSFERLQEIHPGPGISWVTGKVYGELQEYSTWAELYRGSGHYRWFPESGDPEPEEYFKIKYCSKDKPEEKKEEIFHGTWTEGQNRLKDLRKAGNKIEDARRTDDIAVKKEQLLEYKITYNFFSYTNEITDGEVVRENFKGTWPDLQQYIQQLKANGCYNISTALVDPGKPIDDVKRGKNKGSWMKTIRNKESENERDTDISKY